MIKVKPVSKGDIKFCGSCGESAQHLLLIHDSRVIQKVWSSLCTKCLHKLSEQVQKAEMKLLLKRKKDIEDG